MKMIFGVIAALLFATAAQAQVPVTVTSDVPGTLNHLETIAKWKAQFDQMTNQLKQLEQQYTAVTGSRNLGEIFNNPALRDYLPKDWQQTYDAVKAGGVEGLTGRGKSIYEASKVFDLCSAMTMLDQRRNCEAQAVKGAQDKGFAMEAFDAAKSRINELDGLMKSINSTNDPKAVGELQARIAVEQARIQNEQTKLQLYQMVAQAEDRLQQQQQKEIQARTWAAKGGIKATAPTFGSGQ